MEYPFSLPTQRGNCVTELQMFIAVFRESHVEVQIMLLVGRLWRVKGFLCDQNLKGFYRHFEDNSMGQNMF